MMRLLFCITAFIALVLVASAAAGLDQVADAQVTQYRLTADQLQRSEALYRVRSARYLADLAFTVLVLLALLRFRVAVRYRDWAERVTKRRFIQAFVFTGSLLFTIAAATLPFDAHGHFVALRYNLSVQGWGSWLWDWSKQQLLVLAVATFVVSGLYALIRRSPRLWWLYGWASAVPVVIFFVFMAPLIIDPLFSHYQPLGVGQPQLVSDIERVVQRAGLEIPETRFFEMRASEKVTTYNAYVTGLGASKRVVVWDNTYRDLTRPETLFIFGHEMGHYVLHHVWKGIAVALAGLFIGLWLTARLLDSMFSRYGHGLGIRSVGDWASLPLLLLIATLLSFAAQPIASAYSRHLEHEADIYGLEVIREIVPNSSQAAASAFQKLGSRSLSYPHPHALLVFWAYSHPPVAERLRFSLEYAPWDQGKTPLFVK